MLKIELPEPRLTEELTWRNKPILRRPRKPRPKRRKRKPAGRIRLSKFGDTPVGRIIRAECPHEWDLLASLSVKITPEMIERISYSSGNPVFRTERFMTWWIKSVAELIQHWYSIEENISSPVLTKERSEL